MREIGLKAQWIKPYTITTIDSNFSEEYKNIFDEQFNPDSPDAVWCSDITYKYEGLNGKDDKPYERLVISNGNRVVMNYKYCIHYVIERIC